jgi:hypothetical protein
VRENEAVVLIVNMSSYILSQLIAQLVAGLPGDAVNGFKKRYLSGGFALDGRVPPFGSDPPNRDVMLKL